MLTQVKYWLARRGRKSVLFYRNFQRYTGGHQKVADYFHHCQLRPDLSPVIHFSDSSLWDATNPWLQMGAQSAEFTPRDHDLLFLAGMDWQKYLECGVDPKLPVINLIQHVRHADPGADVYPFLTERAVRICVSQEVEEAIRATGRVNGPVVTIANGHDVPQLPLDREIDVLILGTKQSKLGHGLEQRLRTLWPDLSITLVVKQVPRAQLLAIMATSRVSVVLPNPTEGFYLPALESMALSDVTVVPDCVGNRSFCFDGMNCLMPALELGSLTLAVDNALKITKHQFRLAQFKAAAHEQLVRHSLEGERQQFYRLLDDLPGLWSQI